MSITIPGVPELPPVKIAFHATLGSATRAQTGQFFVFDQERLDTASAYDQTDGLFIAPESGVYVLTWTVTVQSSSYATTELAINGRSHGKTIANSGSTGNAHTSTGTVVASLVQHDRVHIQFAPKFNAGSIDVIDGLNSFSGWKLT